MAVGVLLLLITAGCAGIAPERLVPPKESPGAPPKLATSLHVLNVTGGRKGTFGGPEMVDNKAFKEALVLALQGSGLFDSVSVEKGDFELSAAILSQKQADATRLVRGLEYTAIMTVSYTITDKTGKTLFSESYDSESSSIAFAGATRTRVAREGAARENLKIFLKELPGRWPKK